MKEILISVRCEKELAAKLREEGFFAETKKAAVSSFEERRKLFEEVEDTYGEWDTPYVVVTDAPEAYVIPLYKDFMSRPYEMPDLTETDLTFIEKSLQTNPA